MPAIDRNRPPQCWRFVSQALLIAGAALVSAAAAYAGSGVLPAGPFICVWEHDPKIDITPAVNAVGFNTVWVDDKAWDGVTKFEDTLFYRNLHAPGIQYGIAIIDRGVWGWKHDQALRHAEWIAKLSLTHKGIIGLYLNDYYEEIREVEKGGRTAEQWAEIIARIRAVNPKLAIWAPLYPPGELKQPWDFDHDAIIFNVYNQKQIPNAEQLLIETEKKFPGKPIITGLYLNTGTERRWLTEAEFKQMMDLFVRHINEGKTVGLRIFRAKQLDDRPEFAIWAREALKNLKRKPQ